MVNESSGWRVAMIAAASRPTCQPKVSEPSWYTAQTSAAKAKKEIPISMSSAALPNGTAVIDTSVTSG